MSSKVSASRSKLQVAELGRDDNLFEEWKRESREGMVLGAGFEPATPTMSM